MNQAYFDGDFYQCIEAASAGESPETDPTKWRKVRLLGKWRFVLASLTFANLLDLDGQKEKAIAERANAYGRPRVGLEDLTRQEANAEEIKERQPQGAGRATSAVAGSGKSSTVKASVVLDDAYRMIGWDADQIDDRDKSDARMCLSQALQEVWEAWWWHELMLCAQTQFAEDLGSFIYVEGETAYSADEDKYFTALGPFSGDNEPPQGYWEEYVPNRGPLAAWDENTAYEVFDQVSYGGLDYQCAFPSTPAGTLPTGVGWLPLTNWAPILPYTTPAASESAGEQVGPFGPIRGVSKYDPRTCALPGFFELDVTADGTRVLNLDCTHPWVWSRIPTPILVGDDWDATASYEAIPAEELGWVSGSVGGVGNISGEGSPVGAVTPDFINQFYRDTLNNTLWQATGLTNADWIQWI